MARIFTAGMELGDYFADGFTNYQGTLDPARTSRVVPTSPGGNGGSYSLYLLNNNGVQHDISPVVPGGVDEFYFRCHINMGNRTDGTWERFRFMTAAGALLLRFATVDGGSGLSPGGLWYPRFYNSVGGIIADNILFTYHNHDWHLMETYVKFAGSGGRLKVWIDNEVVIDYTGSLVGPAAETQMSLFVPNYQIVTGGGPNSTYYDDMAINDLTGPTNNGRIGDGYVIRLVPSGNGSASQLTNPSSTSVDNFQFVNQLPRDSDQGFVAPAAVNGKDLYTMSAPPAEFHGVNVIRMSASAVGHGAAITKLKMLLKPPVQAELNEPVGVGVGLTLPVGSEEFIGVTFENNANTANDPFTIAELKGMESGVQFIA